MDSMRKLLICLTALWVLTAFQGCCLTHGVCDCDRPDVPVGYDGGGQILAPHAVPDVPH
jgi:hypothetical protein